MDSKVYQQIVNYLDYYSRDLADLQVKENYIVEEINVIDLVLINTHSSIQPAVVNYELDSMAPDVTTTVLVGIVIKTVAEVVLWVDDEANEINNQVRMVIQVGIDPIVSSHLNLDSVETDWEDYYVEIEVYVSRVQNLVFSDENLLATQMLQEEAWEVKQVVSISYNVHLWKVKVVMH